MRIHNGVVHTFTQVARRWRFYDREGIAKLEQAVTLPNADLKDVAAELAQRKYYIFRQVRHAMLMCQYTHIQLSHRQSSQGTQLYAFKGLAGKLGPVGVHASMLGIIAGVAVCVLCSSTGDLVIPEGGRVPTAAGLQPASPLARLPDGGRTVLQVGVAVVTTTTTACFVSPTPLPFHNTIAFQQRHCHQTTPTTLLSSGE